MAKIKLTYSFIKESFEKEYYILLTKKYLGSFQKLDYICPKGHKESIIWGNWQQGCRCPKCYAKKRRLSIEFIQEQFQKEGYILLTEEYINAFSVLVYICPKGHTESTKWNYWQQGNRCPKCQLENNKGKKHYRYNPNLTDEERENKRLGTKIAVWRKNIFERDNYTCQCCGQIGGTLNAHHRDNWADNPELRYDPDNGVTLCEKCHKAFHHIYGRKKTTAIQTDKFIIK